MSEALTREFGLGFKVNLVQDHCGCTYSMTVSRAHSGTISVDPDTLEVTYVHTIDPIPLAKAKITNPFRPDHADRPDLPPLNTTIIVEDAALSDRLLRFYLEHYTRFLTDAQKADEAHMARVTEEATTAATEMANDILEVAHDFDAADGFKATSPDDLFGEPLFGVSPLMVMGLADLLGSGSIGGGRITVREVHIV